jgi:pentatricopeptide repeat protein
MEAENPRVVKYDNAMSTVAFKKFNARELDLFFAICADVADRGSEPIVYSFEDLRKKSKVYAKDKKDFAEALDSTYAKFLSLNIRLGNNIEWTRFTLFTKFEISLVKENVTVKVNEDFAFLLNELAKEFTIFDLSTYLMFKSIYTKECFRQLNKYKKNGWWKVSLEEFSRLLAIPESYKTFNIEQKVLSKIEEELSEYYTEFSIERITEKQKRGRPKLKTLVFKFKKEEKNLVTYVMSYNEIVSNNIFAELTNLEIISPDQLLNNEYIIEFGNAVLPTYNCFINKHGKQELMKHLSYVVKKMKDKNIEKLASYLLTSLKNYEQKLEEEK